MIRDRYSDNGSEYINNNVAKLLEKLRIEQTKSGTRPSNDNTLVESKFGSMVFKHLEYRHIPERSVKQINAFAD